MSNPQENPTPAAKPCPTCGGGGEIEIPGIGMMFPGNPATCPDCNGTGVTPPTDTQPAKPALAEYWRIAKEHNTEHPVRTVIAIEALVAQARHAAVEAELSELIDLFLANEPQDANAIPVHVLTVLEARLAALKEYGNTSTEAGK